MTQQPTAAGVTGAEAALPAFAWRDVGAVTVIAVALLVALSGRYGYHRDELYFIACGRHLAWGYPDQPVLVPLLARAMTGISSSSVVVLRLPSDVAAAITLLFTGLTARELGYDRPVQLLATIAMALSSVFLATGHLLSTATLDLTAWTVVVWIGLRALRTGNDRWWLLAGLGVGIGLLASDLIAFLAVAVLVGLAVTGSRRVLRSPWLLAGVVVAVLLWAPYLVWQAQHGWPELAVSHSIATGGSGTSAPRWAFLPQQFLMSGPLLSPLWVAGLVALIRRRQLRWLRPFLVALVVLAVVFIVTDGKPYYIDGLLPLLFAIGADRARVWARRGAKRRGLLVVLCVASLPDVPITLPLVPLGVLHQTPIVAIDYDSGETVGWPTYVRQIEAVYDGIPPDDRRGTVVLASNYGEAGAVQRYAAGVLPTTYAVQNAYWLWGPPPASADRVVAVGFDRGQLERLFRQVHPGTTLHNHQSVDDDEQGEPVFVCSGLRRPWTTVWRGLREYG